MALMDKLNNLNPEYRKQQAAQKQAQAQEKNKQIDSLTKKRRNSAIIGGATGALGVGVGLRGNTLRKAAPLAAQMYKSAQLAQGLDVDEKALKFGEKLTKNVGKAGMVAGGLATLYGGKKLYDSYQSHKKLKQTRGFNFNYIYLSDF